MKYYKVIFFQNNRNDPIVLTFYRLSFLRDQNNLNKSNDINLIIIKPYVWATFTKVFYPEYMRGQVKFHTLNDDKSEKIKKEAEDFIFQVLIRLKEKHLVDSFLFGSIDYMEQQSWAGAAKKLEIPVVVFYCEGAGFGDYFYNYYLNIDHIIGNSRFIFDKIFIPGQQAKKLYLEAKVTTEDNLVVTGCPRTDNSYELFKTSMLSRDMDKNNILLFAFSDSNYFAPKLWQSVLEEFLKLAKDNNDYNFYVKTKNNESTELITDSIDKKYANVSNIYFVHELDTKILKDKIRFIISFSSTLLIESMVSTIPLLVPMWNDGIKSLEKGATILDLNNDATQYLYSIESFKDLCNELLDDLSFSNYVKKIETTKNGRNEYINYYVDKIDGKRTKFLAQKLLELIE